MDLASLINLYLKNGYEFEDASAKVAQDIILLKISNSVLNKNVTIKGGVVIHNISNDKRRATRDLDFDFIKYSLDDESIVNFINVLNKVNDGIKIDIKGRIEELHHQDYNGKRVYIIIKDNYSNLISSKLDIGVHKNFDLIQDEYCFNFDIISQSATLLINSVEQIFVEKMKSLLKFGLVSTRYKDLFDFYYFINNDLLDYNKMIKCFEEIIFNDINFDVNNYVNIKDRINIVFKNKKFINNLTNPKNNWLNISSNEVIDTISTYLDKFKD